MNAKNLTLTLVVLLTSFGGVAMADQIGREKTIEKAREAVSNASPDDWYILANSAKKCFRKNVNMKEAVAWLDRSLEIVETSFNLELKGDYYVMNQLPDQAIAFYVKAIKAIDNKSASNADVRAIQEKIAHLMGDS